MSEEERCDCLKAMVHEHLCSYVKKTTGIDANLTLLGERSHRHHDDLNSLERERKKQKVFNHCMEAKMLDLEGMIEGQADCIAELEEDVTILRSKKECKCKGVSVRNFMVFSKLLFPLFKPSLHSNSSLTISQLNEPHDTRTTKMITSIANMNTRPGNCYVYMIPPLSY